MTLWFRQVTENETLRVRAERSPGPEWVELERDYGPGESVSIVDGKAEIIAAEEPKVDLRRAAIQAALIDVMMAVADGGDLREELSKVLSKVE